MGSLFSMLLYAQNQRIEIQNTTCKCKSFFGLSSCEASCPPPGGAVCLTIYGFCQCGCVNTGSKSVFEATINNENVKRYYVFLDQNLIARLNSVKGVINKYFNTASGLDYKLSADSYTNLLTEYSRLIDGFTKDEKSKIENYFKIE